MGSRTKPDFAKLYPDPPMYSLLPGSLDKYQGQIQSLVDLFGRRADGTDQFDYLKYVFGPQETMLNQQYGINTTPGDVYSRQSGILPQMMASLNKRGLGDVGTSGVIEGQLRSNLSNQLASLFGQAKVGQKNDIDAAIAALGQLYPAQFETNQIGPNISYQNAIERFNQDFRRNSAQQSYESSKPGNPFSSLIGGAIGSIFGQPALGSSVGSMFSGGGWAQPQGGGGGLGSLLGGFNLGGLFGGGGGGGGQQSFQMPGQSYASQTGLFSNQGGNYLATKYPSLFGAPGF